MAVHQIFAENLRREVMRFRTIAEVCEGIGINRQQFNKYLAGSAIPSALTLRKICGFLEVPEQALFVSQDRQANHLITPEYGSRAFNNGPFGFLAEARKFFDFEVRFIADGPYFCYFPLNVLPGMLVRSLVLVKHDGKKTSFSRSTMFPFAHGTAHSMSKGRHGGTVFANQSDIYFLGVNRYSPHQLSLMTIERIRDSHQSVFTGFITTRGSNNQVGTKMCMVPCEQDVSIRYLLGKLGLVHSTDANIDPVVTFALNH